MLFGGEGSTQTLEHQYGGQGYPFFVAQVGDQGSVYIAWNPEVGEWQLQAVGTGFNALFPDGP